MTYQVLCAYDGSPSSEEAFEFATTLTRNFQGRLNVLAVVQPPEPAEDVKTEALLESGQERFGKASSACVCVPRKLASRPTSRSRSVIRPNRSSSTPTSGRPTMSCSATAGRTRSSAG